MATWLKSRDKAVCPLTGEPIQPAGSKWSARAAPCVREGKRCEHLAASFASCYYASIQCRYKGAQ